MLAVKRVVVGIYVGIYMVAVISVPLGLAVATLVPRELEGTLVIIGIGWLAVWGMGATWAPQLGRLSLCDDLRRQVGGRKGRGQLKQSDWVGGGTTRTSDHRYRASTFEAGPA